MKKLLLQLCIFVSPVIALAQNQTLVLDSAEGFYGTNVSVPVRCKSFSNVIGFQGTITWDNSALTFVSASGYNSNLGAGNFNTNHQTNNFTYIYSDAVANHTLNDNEIVFYLNFKVYKNSTLNFSSSPTALSIDTAYDIWGYSDLGTLQGNYIDGKVKLKCVTTYSSFNHTICASSPYTFNGNALSITGQYKDTLVNYTGCDSIVTLNLTADTLNLGITPQIGDTLFSKQFSATSYQWIHCGGANVPGETNRYFVPTASGSYAVVLTNASCSGTTACENLIFTSTESIAFANNVTLYPNPTSDALTLDLGEIVEGQVFLYGINGDLISARTIAGKTVQFSLANLAAGLYTVKICTSTQAIVKQVSVVQ